MSRRSSRRLVVWIFYLSFLFVCVCVCVCLFVFGIVFAEHVAEEQKRSKSRLFFSAER